MSKKLLKIGCILMSFLMLLTVFAACGKQTADEETTEPTTEAKPQTQILSSISYKWSGSTKTLAVGDKIELDGSGRIVSVKKTYDTIAVEYDENGLLSRIEVTDDEGKIGFENVVYENGLPVSREYDANNGFRSLQDSEIETKTDENGRVTEMIEHITYTDVDDGSKSYSTITTEYDYDENGRICERRYYSDGELDHTTTLTYDENGNLSVYSNYGSSLGEYLRFEFAYESVDADTVASVELDSFSTINNFDLLLDDII